MVAEQMVRRLGIKKVVLLPSPFCWIKENRHATPNTLTGSRHYWQHDQPLTRGTRVSRETFSENASLSGGSPLKPWSTPPHRQPAGYPGAGEGKRKASAKGKPDRKHRVVCNRQRSSFHSNTPSKQP